MHLKRSALLGLIFGLFLSVNGFALYIEPQETYMTNVFDEMKAKSDQNSETFSTMASFLLGMKDSCHQFYFQYPLESAEQAKTFAKVMQIKAQQAHRFVPVIENSEFIEPRNLGFSRRITIFDGPIVQEHVLVDAMSDSVIFIEEFVITPNGEVHPGCFAALNSIMENDGAWYFSGIYLYDEQPTAQVVQERENMFRLTYENMIDFMSSNDVDLIFNELKGY